MIQVRVLQVTKLKHGVMIETVGELYQAWRQSYTVPYSSIQFHQLMVFELGRQKNPLSMH